VVFHGEEIGYGIVIQNLAIGIHDSYPHFLRGYKIFHGIKFPEIFSGIYPIDRNIPVNKIIIVIQPGFQLGNPELLLPVLLKKEDRNRKNGKQYKEIGK
jgi:hypothetical protein